MTGYMGDAVDIRERVRGVIERISGIIGFPDDICLGGRPFEHKGLELDSLDRIDIALNLEEQFGIEIPDADLDRPEMSTPAGLISYVAMRLAVQE